MISEKKDRLLGSSGSSKTKPRGEKIVTFGLKQTHIGGAAQGLTLRMPIAERRCSHVTQANGAFATAVHKHVALVWMTLGSCDYFCQLLHVGRFDVYNIWERTH